jgi:alpha-glucosidase (family GH31 glycosyl hydrolase)
MLGTSLLVVPTVEEGETARKVYLPAGARWVSYWSGAGVEGNRPARIGTWRDAALAHATADRRRLK